MNVTLKKLMRLVCLFLSLLTCSIGSSEEIYQGVLSNGMHYYLCPDFIEEDEVSVALFIKKPETLALFPWTDPFITTAIFPDEEDESYGRKYELARRYSDNSLVLSIFSVDLEGEQFLGSFLAYMAERLKLETFPSEVIDKLRENHQSMKVFQGEANWLCLEKLSGFLYGGLDQKHIDEIFSKADHELNQMYRTFFEPSQMCLIVTGTFDPVSIEKELENLFGSLLGNRVSQSVKFKHENPVAASFKEPGIATSLARYLVDEEDEEDYSEINLYCYQFHPSFRNYVLNDLFLCSNFFIDEDSDSPPLRGFCKDYFFPFFVFEEDVAAQVDESAFLEAKEELEAIYRGDTMPKIRRCANHFLSGITDDLLLSNQNLLYELESVTLEELNGFVKSHIQKTPVSYEINGQRP